MRYQLPLTSVIAILLFVAPATAQQAFQLSGNIKGGYKGKVFLSYEGRKDSVALDQDNNFHFAGEIGDSVQAALHLGGTSTIGWIYLEPSNIKVQAHHQLDSSQGKVINDLNIDSVYGSRSEEMRRQLTQTLKTIRESKETDSIKQQKMYEAVRLFVEGHRQHRLSPFFAANRSFTFDQINSLYRLLDSSLYKTEEVFILVRLLQQKQAVKQGSALMDISMPDSAGIIRSTKDIPQPLVLVEFWASWCGPCVAQIPDLKNIYAKHHANGLEIVGISLDTERKSWLKAMNKLQMGWPNISELNGWDSQVVKRLSIFSIPFNVLVYKGTIVAINLSPEDLEPKVGEILSGSRH